MSDIITGHAGVLTYNDNGFTTYHTFGRYLPSNKYSIGNRQSSSKGNVLRIPVKNLKMKDGKPTSESWKKLMKDLSKKDGKHTEPEPSCDQKADEKKVIKFAENFANNKKRPGYEWKPWKANHCRTFSSDANNFWR